MRRLGSVACVTLCLFVVSQRATAQSSEAGTACVKWAAKPVSEESVKNLIVSCEKAIAERPNTSLYKHVLAIAYQQTGKPELATPLYRVLATGGDAMAQHALGSMYKNGSGVTKDMNAAYHWLNMAAKQGHATAQFDLARIHEEKNSSYADPEKSAFWMQKAAEAQHMEAEYNMYRLKSEGLGGKRSSREADAWLEKSANHGYAPAQFKLGEMIHYTRGSDRAKEEKALQLFNLSAEQGFGPAQMKLGMLYENGLGVPVDKQKSILWYRRAVSSGEKAASERVVALTQSGTSSRTSASNSTSTSARTGTDSSSGDSSSSNWIFWIIGGAILLRFFRGSSRTSTSRSSKNSDWQMPKQKTLKPCPTCLSKGYTWDTYGSTRPYKSHCVRCHTLGYIES